MKRLTTSLMAMVFGSVLSIPATATPISPVPLYVFGDSLSDIGNVFRLSNGAIPPAGRYYRGRFSNGPVYSEQLATRLGVSLKPSEAEYDLGAGDSVSFAYGGAGTGEEGTTPDGLLNVPGVQGQIRRYRNALDAAGVAVDPDALFLLWGGANAYLFGDVRDPTKPVGNLTSSIETLYGLGARNLVVINLPDLGKVPISKLLGVDAEALSRLSLAHNRLLAGALTELGATLPDLNLSTLDINALFDQLRSEPAAFGLTDATSAGPAAGCLFPPFDCEPVDGAGSFLFWDELHPTTKVHGLIADRVYRAVTAVSEPSSAALLAVALLGLVAVRLQIGARSRV